VLQEFVQLLGYLNISSRPPIKWYWSSPTSLSRFVGGDVAAVPQYISPNTHMKGRSYKSVRENMSEKW